ncbi:YegP family protein [Roseovarius atlanticus]|uniref:YegP family protein n=1 Tax=Roseovarius atlanticus TaxID=1641875 RepID=UPI000A81C5F5|nr:YegP family protein [Roseovarius atlanticus]
MDERYECKIISAGKPMFNLKAGSGQVIGTSQSYTSASASENIDASVESNAPSARVDDQTT